MFRISPGPLHTAESFVLGQMSDEGRESWRRMVDTLTADEAIVISRAWGSVLSARLALNPISPSDIRAKAAIARLMLSNLLVSDESGDVYQRTAAGKMCAAYLHGRSNGEWP